MSVNRFIKMKGVEKIAVLTAYDCLTARLAWESGMDILLVGDSLGMVFAGHDSTLPVTVDDMVYHVRAVRRGAPGAFIIADMPFMSYGIDLAEGVKNAGRMLKEGGANAVKIEGGREFAGLVRAADGIGVPVMGHIGLKPQSVNQHGRRITGKTVEETAELVEDAKALEKAGVFGMVLEGMTEEAAKEVTAAVAVPTIGIGAGRYTDGQVLVVTDMLGMDERVSLKHNRNYASLHKVMRKAFRKYREDVKGGAFPSEENLFHR